ncbi:MAG: ribonuclease HII [Methanosarcinales archaeon]|nr:ribonuclease HII [Methanosarcinales archaeon]
MLVAGVDEAGKGPVLGPMIVAGVVMEEAILPELGRLGVKDSKVLSPVRRNYLSAKIKEIATSYHILEVSAAQIDEMRNIMTMNQLMVVTHAKVLQNLKPDVAYLDAADVKEERFGENVKQRYAAPINIIAKHKADATYPIVAAASILAKVRRDRIIMEREREMGVVLGSGYPSDPKTRKFLEEWIKVYGSLPDIARHSWKTSENLLEKMGL